MPAYVHKRGGRVIPHDESVPCFECVAAHYRVYLPQLDNMGESKSVGDDISTSIMPGASDFVWPWLAPLSGVVSEVS